MSEETKRKTDVSGSLPFLFSRKTIIEFCNWSKQAEWRDGGRKEAFIKSDWETYLKLFLKDRADNKKGNLL